jgi:hypothetical protein
MSYENVIAAMKEVEPIVQNLQAAISVIKDFAEKMNPALELDLDDLDLELDFGDDETTVALEKVEEKAEGR